MFSDSRLRRWFLPPKNNVWHLVLLTAFVLSAGCATRPERFTELKEGQWEARVTVEDKKKNKTFSLTASFKAVPLDRLRIDLLTPTGAYIGSIAVNGNAFQALMAREKKFYRGPAAPAAMKKVLSLPLDPHWLNHFLFDVPPPGWDCRFDQDEFLEQCSNAGQGIQVNWSQRVKNRKVIQIEADTFSAKIFLGRFFPSIEDGDEAFHLEPPKGFRILRIR